MNDVHVCLGRFQRHGDTSFAALNKPSETRLAIDPIVRLPVAVEEVQAAIGTEAATELFRSPGFYWRNDYALVVVTEFPFQQIAVLRQLVARCQLDLLSPIGLFCTVDDIWGDS